MKFNFKVAKVEISRDPATKTVTTLLFGTASKGQLKAGDILSISSGYSLNKILVSNIILDNTVVQSIDLKTTKDLMISTESSDHKIKEGDILKISQKLSGHIEFNPKLPLQPNPFKGINFENVLKDKVLINRKSLDEIFKVKKPLGIVLQGGGLKGAFGVGAINQLQLAQVITPDKHLKIASASTGSITAVMLAQRTNDSVAKAIKEYTSLHSLKDMFEIRQEILNIIRSNPELEEFVVNTLKTGSVSFDSIQNAFNKYKDRSIKNTLVETINNPLTYIAPLIAIPLFSYLKTKDDIEKIIRDIKKLSEVKLSLAVIEPVARRLDNSINANALHSKINIDKNIGLRIAVTSLNSGATCYITENLRLLYPKKGGVGDGTDYTRFDDFEIKKFGDISVSTSPDQLKFGLIRAAISSGAFPALFEPQEISFLKDKDIVSELFSDGGIKENLPIASIISDVEKTIAVHCSPITDFYYSTKHTKSYSWVKVATEALGFIDQENARSDMSVGDSINTDLHGIGNNKVLHIAPIVSTIGLTEVNPFKIKSTIWYGAMRTYDELLIQKLIESDIESSTMDELKVNIRSSSTEIFVRLIELYEVSETLVKNAAYRVKKSKKYNKWEYVPWGPGRTVTTYSPGGAGNSIHRYVIPGLLNWQKPKYLAFEIESLLKYYEVRRNLVEAIVNRFEIAEKLDDAKGLQLCIPAGDPGLWDCALYCDWTGVYEVLEHINMPVNKRLALINLFRKEDSLDRNNYYRTDELLKDDSLQPNQINSHRLFGKFNDARKATKVGLKRLLDKKYLKGNLNSRRQFNDVYIVKGDDYINPRDKGILS